MQTIIVTFIFYISVLPAFAQKPAIKSSYPKIMLHYSVLYEITGLNSGKHSIAIINRGGGKVTVDALIVQ